jgi:hypothetical protein
LRQRKKQPWVSMDLSTNAYWETIPPWHYKIEEKQLHFTSYVENSPKAIDYYIECQIFLLIYLESKLSFSVILHTQQQMIPPNWLRQS